MRALRRPEHPGRLSILVAPVPDGSVGTATLFDASEKKGPARGVDLMSVENSTAVTVWLCYRIRQR